MVSDLKELKTKNPNKLIIGQWNKFEMLIQEDIKILMVLEIKINNSFPIGQFVINTFKTLFRVDPNEHGGGDDDGHNI